MRPGAVGPGPALAFDGGGTECAVWGQFPLGGASTGTVEVTVRPPGGAFSAPRSLGPIDTPLAGGPPQMVADAADDALVVWQVKDTAGNFRIQASYQPAGGTLARRKPSPRRIPFHWTWLEALEAVGG